MKIYKQIVFLSMLLIAVMVTCVFTHIKDFEVEVLVPNTEFKNNLVEETNSTKEIVNDEQAIQEESLKIEEEIKEEDIQKEIIEEKIEVKEKEDIKEVEIVSADLPSNKRIEELSKRIEPKLQEEKIEETNIQEELDLIFKDEKIVFKRLSTNITDESKILVKKVADVLNKYKNIKVEIGGHTDAKGKADVNQWISLQRAISVKKELIALGILQDRIQTKGYGETKPLVANNENGYAIENRRVEIKVIGE